MSFRTRLTSFFVVIVVLPMVALGVMLFRLISQSGDAKAHARASGLATAAATLYQHQVATARADAAAIARQIGALQGKALVARASRLASEAAVARLTITRGARRIVDVGEPTAIAPGAATLNMGAGKSLLTIRVSEITAGEYARELSEPGVGVVVTAGPRRLSATLPHAPAPKLPGDGAITIGGKRYWVTTLRGLSGFDRPTDVSVLSSTAATASSVTSDRLLAGGVIAGFLLLAFSFSVLSSRQLHAQVSRFLQAAKRLGSGDFSASAPVEGGDEFAQLGEEFNQMASQLKHKIDDLAQERARLRESVRRIGETFASNLDRPALLDLALKTALDAVNADRGRLSTRAERDEPLSESVRVGSFDGSEDRVLDAERAALSNGGLGESSANGVSFAAVALGAFDTGPRVHGLITVGREGEAFNAGDRDLLRSLAAQATLALENVELHLQVSRQAVTDELTGLTNHRRFQEQLALEFEEVRRYHHPVGLIMLDIDNFKDVNDTYGHPQGDVVLRHVARVLRDSSREVDVPARYGGEEMALILPHTDIEGAYAIAERVRLAVESARIPRLDEQGQLKITASVGVASATDGTQDQLIARADAALYEAKRAGKNRTVQGQPDTANVFGAE